MSAFENAIERGEIDLAEYGQPFRYAREVAEFVLDEENLIGDAAELRYAVRRLNADTLDRWILCKVAQIAVVAASAGLNGFESETEQLCAAAVVIYAARELLGADYRPGPDWNAYGTMGEGQS